MVEGARSRRLVRRAECHRILRNNPGVREAENEQQPNRRLDPEYRAHEQVADTERHVIARLDPEYREQENEQRHNRRTDPEYTEQENDQQRNRRLDPEYRAREQVADTERSVRYIERLSLMSGGV